MNSYEMSKVYEREIDQSVYPYSFYMSWGWGGYYDGFYSASNFNDPTVNTDTPVTSKKILYNITYNN